MSDSVRHTFGKPHEAGDATPALAAARARYAAGGRRRSGRLRGLVVGLLAGATLAACMAGPAPATAAAASSCPTPAPATAAGWQQLSDRLPFRGDGNFSAALPDGRSAWVTGDAIPRAGGPWASNTVTVVDAGCTWQTPAAVPDAADGTALWLGPTAAVGGKVVSLGSRIRRTPGVGFGFAPVRTEVAVFDLPAGAWTPKLVRLSATPGSPANIRWSAGIFPAGPEVYVWGTTDGREGQWGVDAYLARVPATQFPVGGAWRYWTGSTWSTSAGAARPVLSAAAGDGTDTAFTARRDATGTWSLYTRRGGAWGGEHGQYVGRPGGKWAWQARGTEPGYLPSTHLEAPLASGQLLVTVNVDGVGPRFLEVAR